MSKVIFYTTDVAEKVTTFLSEIRFDDDKAKQFITFEQMAAKTKVTLESDPSEVVSSIITFASLIDGIIIFIPWMGLIRGTLKEYIDSHSVTDVTYQILSDINEDIPVLSGELDTTVIKVPTEAALVYELFNPTVKSVLYLMKTENVEEVLQNITEKSMITFSGIDNIKEVCGVKENEQIAIAVPQLQVGGWVEMIHMLESLTLVSPVNTIYLELDEDDTPDFFINSILNTCDPSITVVRGVRNFEVGERDSDDEEEIPTVDAEIVSE